MKIAILGASGIGKNHARWLTQNGAEVVAFLGSSAGSVERTQALLQKSIGFTGQGFTDLSRLLQDAAPDAVCVATPNERHYDHVLQCLELGLPVLCEKPLVHDPELTDNECRRRAHHLVEVAGSRGLLFGTQMQYVFAGPVIQQLSGVDPDEITRFSMVMQTKNVMAGRTHRILWIDLAPHPISLLQSMIPGITLDASLAYEERALDAIAVFRMRRPDGRTIRVSVEIGCVPGRDPRREVLLNDSRVDYAGFQDTDGVFKARVWNTKGETCVVPDFVNSLMGNFVRAHAGTEPLRVTGAMGAENLDWLLRLSDPDLI